MCSVVHPLSSNFRYTSLIEMSDDEQLSAGQSQGTQQSQSQESRGYKQWKLSGGNMVVLSHGKKKPTDTHTILELEFTFDFDKKPKKVG